MEYNIPPCFYRVSIKALILDETRTKFLVVQEDNGKWEFPGGGLDWGATPQEDLSREIQEEMQLDVLWVAQNPSYFITFQTKRAGNDIWVGNLFYETTVASLDFTPSDECVALQFVAPEEGKKLTPQFGNITQLAEQFDPARHQSRNV
jgi:8-oxo-dGTP diphosphatase